MPLTLVSLPWRPSAGLARGPTYADAGRLFERFDHRREIGIGALVAHGGLPNPSDRFGDVDRHAQRSGLVEIEPHIFDHQPGGEPVIEGAREDRARELVTACARRAPDGLKQLNNHAGGDNTT